MVAIEAFIGNSYDANGCMIRLSPVQLRTRRAYVIDLNHQKQKKSNSCRAAETGPSLWYNNTDSQQKAANGQLIIEELIIN